MSIFGVPISAFPFAQTPLVGDELVPLVQSGQTCKVYASAIAALASGGFGDSVNLKTDFGAVGNNIVNDTAATQAFFTYLAANGGTGIIPRGTYRLTTQIAVTANAQPYKAIGEDAALSIFSVDSNSAFATFSFLAQAGVVLEDFSVDVRNNSRVASINNHGIGFSNPNHIRCNNISILNHGGSAILSYVDNLIGTYRDVIYTDCYCDGDEANNGNLAGNGFLIEGCDDSGMTECHAYNCVGDPGITPGIGLQLKNQGFGCWISGGTADNCLTGAACGFDGALGITVGQQATNLNGMVLRNCATGLGLYSTLGVQADSIVIDMQEKVGSGAAISFFGNASETCATNVTVLNTIYFQGAVRFWHTSNKNYVEINHHKSSSGSSTVPTAVIFDSGTQSNLAVIRSKTYNQPVTVAAQAVIDNSGNLTNSVQIGELWFQPEVVVSVMDMGARGDGTTDDTTAFTRAFQSNAHTILVPYPSSFYRITSTIDIPAGKVLLGEGYRPEIRMDTGVTLPMFQFNGITKAGMRNLTLHGNYIASAGGHTINVANSTYIFLREIDFNKSKGDCILASYMQDSIVSDCVFKDSKQHGVDFYNSTSNSRNIIQNNYSNNTAGFGILIQNGAHDNIIRNNSCDLNGLELIGVTVDSYNNIISGNRAAGCGDNGISITGYNNTVTGNECYLNAHNGIFIYGMQNTVVGNTCYNNNVAAGTFVGLGIGMSFGGQARYNIVVGNNCYDTQVAPTQYAGISIDDNQMQVWAASQVVNASNPYRYYGLNTYKALNTGTTGATPPTNTSGTQSDGVITWQFLWTTLYAFQATGNVISGNNYLGNQAGRTLLNNSIGANTINERATNATGNIINTVWAAGQSVTYGDMRYYTDSSGVKHIYRDITAGTNTTGATPPTHSSGGVSDGTVTWLYVATSEFYVQQTNTERNFKLAAPLALQNVEDPTQTMEIMCGAGAPTQTGTPGSIFGRRNSSTPATNMYIWAAGISGWRALMLRDFGATASRTTVGTGGGFSGYQFYDTDMRRPVVWDGAVPGYISTGNMAITVTVSTAVNIYEDNILCGARAAGITITLPAPNTTKATAAELKFMRVKDASGEGLLKNITIESASGNIDASANKTINTDYGVMLFYTDGTAWYTA